MWKPVFGGWGLIWLPVSTIHNSEPCHVKTSLRGLGADLTASVNNSQFWAMSCENQFSGVGGWSDCQCQQFTILNHVITLIAPLHVKTSFRGLGADLTASVNNSQFWAMSCENQSSGVGGWSDCQCQQFSILSNVMWKPVFGGCDQEWRKPACSASYPYLLNEKFKGSSLSEAEQSDLSLSWSQPQSKKISNDQELIQSDPISCPQNQKGNN